jgi:hypothetical protein
MASKLFLISLLLSPALGLTIPIDGQNGVAFDRRHVAVVRKPDPESRHMEILDG